MSNIADVINKGMHHALIEKRALFKHAMLTVLQLEMRLAKRGSTTGKKKWELKLLESAYNAIQTPWQDRKFGLDK